MIGLWLCKLGVSLLMSFLKFLELKFLATYTIKLIVVLKLLLKPNKLYSTTQLIFLKPVTCIMKTIVFMISKEKLLVFQIMFKINKKVKILCSLIKVHFIQLQEDKSMILVLYKSEIKNTMSSMLKKLENASCTIQIELSLMK